MAATAVPYDRGLHPRGKTPCCTVWGVLRLPSRPKESSGLIKCCSGLTTPTGPLGPAPHPPQPQESFSLGLCPFHALCPGDFLRQPPLHPGTQPIETKPPGTLKSLWGGGMQALGSQWRTAEGGLPSCQ